MSLPKTYRQLAYIQSSGTQWIDTGVNGGNTSAGYEIRFNTTGSTATNYEMYFAGDSNPLNKAPKIYAYTGSAHRGYVIVDDGNGGYYPFQYSSTSFHTVSAESGDVSCDDVRLGTPTISSWGTLSFYVFNSHSEPNLMSSMQLEYLKMWTDGVLVRDFIPVQRKSDDVLGLYDLENDVFYTNDGTGTFIAGPIVDENENINKVIYNNQVLIDLTADTATAEDVAQGKTFHLADGSQATGTSQGGSLEEINYSLMCGCSNIDGSSSGYFSICYEIIKPDGGIINVPNIPHLVNSPSNTVGGSIYYNYWKYNNNVNWSFGHESGEGKLPSSTYPSVIWTITGTCPKGSSLRLVYQMHGNANWGALQDVTANILGISTSATYNPSKSTGYTGNYIGTAAIVNDDIVSTYGHRQDNNSYHDWHTISITTAS